MLGVFEPAHDVSDSLERRDPERDGWLRLSKCVPHGEFRPYIRLEVLGANRTQKWRYLFLFDVAGSPKFDQAWQMLAADLSAKVRDVPCDELIDGDIGIRANSVVTLY